MKLSVTPELAILIKTLRARRGIASKDLAKGIGKSPSYLSKLENGDVKTIQKDCLVEILSRVAEGEEFYQDQFRNILNVLGTIMGDRGIFGQKWLLQLDLFDRPVQVPKAMLDDIIGRIETLGISEDRFLDIMNANKDIVDETAYPVNEVSLLDTPEGQIYRLRINIDPKRYHKVMTGEENVTNHAFLYTVVFTLLKLEKYGDIGHMDVAAAKTILNEAERYLVSYEVYSLTRYGQILSSGEFQSNQLFLLDNFKAAKADTVKGIVEILREMAEHDSALTAHYIDCFKNNLQWDPAFMLCLMGLKFDRLEGLSFSNKKNLLAEITELVRRYDQMSEVEKRLERY